MFRKKKDTPKETPAAPAAASATPSQPPPVEPRTLSLLQRLEQTGVQLLVRVGGGAESYTSEVVGLGRDGFFIDTLSPPEGDRHVVPGRAVEIETLFQGISYHCEAAVLGKVQFVDELPAYKLAFPDGLRGERRRKSPRIQTQGDVSLSFLRPFACDAPVVNLSEGGLAFEYGADAGHLRRGTVLQDVLLELGERPVITVQGKIVGNLVAELGGISLPRRYRCSIAFQGLGPADLEAIRGYLATVQPVHVEA